MCMFFYAYFEPEWLVMMNGSVLYFSDVFVSACEMGEQEYMFSVTLCLLVRKRVMTWQV